MGGNRTTWLWIIGIAAIIIALFWIGKNAAHPQPNVNINPDTLAGIQTNLGPWIAEKNRLQERLNAIGLPALTTEGEALHTHQHIDVFVHGQPVTVPAEIGVNEIANFISPVHTHDPTQVIHVESPVVQTFTLGQFFDIWGVRLTAQCIGGYCQTGDNTLKVFSNGTLVTGDPRMLELTAHQEIAVIFGTSTETPSTIPSSFKFDPGL